MSYINEIRMRIGELEENELEVIYGIMQTYINLHELRAAAEKMQIDSNHFLDILNLEKDKLGRL